MKKELLFTRKQGKIKTEEQEMKKIKCEVMNFFCTSTNSTNKAYPSLTAYEKKKIEEVVGYYSIFKDENCVGNMFEELDREHCMEFIEEYSKVVIKCVKNIPAVKNYSIEDKVVMMRNFLGVFADLRITFNYQFETNISVLQNFTKGKENTFSRMNMDVWDDYFPLDLKNAWLKIVERNKFAMMNDPIIRDLLITMGLFLESDKISCPQVLRNHYLEYYYLLRRYLQTKLKTREKFEKKMRLFHNVLGGYPEINYLNKEFFQSLWPYYTSELISEVYYLE